MVRIAKLPGMAIIFYRSIPWIFTYRPVIGEDKATFYDWLMKKQSQIQVKSK